MGLSAHLDQARCDSFHSPFLSSQADFPFFPVTLGGAVLFLIFGVLYSYEAYYYVEDEALTALAGLS
jgi:hypothetical protein